MNMTSFLSEALIDSYFTAGTKYISLHTGDPGAAGTANEVTTGMDANYARKAATFVKSANGLLFQAKNNADVVFNAAAAGASHTITYLSVFSAASGGNCLARLQLSSPLPVSGSTVVSFALNDIVIKGE